MWYKFHEYTFSTEQFAEAKIHFFDRKIRRGERSSVRVRVFEFEFEFEFECSILRSSSVRVRVRAFEGSGSREFASRVRVREFEFEGSRVQARGFEISRVQARETKKNRGRGLTPTPTTAVMRYYLLDTTARIATSEAVANTARAIATTGRMFMLFISPAVIVEPSPADTADRASVVFILFIVPYLSLGTTGGETVPPPLLRTT